MAKNALEKRQDQIDRLEKYLLHSENGKFCKNNGQDRKRPNGFFWQIDRFKFIRNRVFFFLYFKDFI